MKTIFPWVPKFPEKSESLAVVKLRLRAARDDAESDRLVNDDNLVGYPFVVQSVPFVG